MTTDVDAVHVNRGFIGREAELAALRQALGRACQRVGSVVLIAGPPGIGKTRIAQEVALHAAQHGVRVLWGRCPEEPGAPPYWPWLQAVRQYVASDDGCAQETLGSAAAYLVALDASLASRLSNQPLAVPPADAARARFQLFDAIAAFWQRAALREPLLLVLDDLHCADVPSLRLLDFVARESAASQLLIVGTYRDAEVTRAHPLADTLGALARMAGMQRLQLTGFTVDETARFVGAVGAGLAPNLAALMHARTEGHPLFLAEMARLFDEIRVSGRGTLPTADLQRVPAGVRDVIGSRLNRLTPLCGHVLGSAAIIGRRFRFDLLMALLDEVSEDQCCVALEEARGASLIEELAEPAAYQFSHALVREALYAEMPAPRRMRLHQRVAVALERTREADPATSLVALAYHFGASRPTEGAAKAVAYATRAAQQADAALAYEEAARLYGEALQRLEPNRDAERCELLLALGDARLKVAEHEEAIGAFTEAAKIARRIALPNSLARAALGYETCAWRSVGGAVVAAALVKEALVANSPLDSPQRARLLAALCRALVYADRFDAAAAIHNQAVQMARRLTDAEALFAALSAIVPARRAPELLARRLAAGREAMQLAEREGKPEWAVGHLTGWHIGDLVEAGDIAGAARIAEFGADSAAVAHQPFARGVLISCCALIAMHRGRFEEGEALANESIRHANKFGQTTGAAAVQLFTLRREQGRLGELAPVLEHFQRTMPDSAIWQPGYLILCCELGRREQAAATFDKLAAKDFELGQDVDAGRAGSLAYLAEACAWLEDSKRARLLYRELSPHAGRGIVFGSHVVSMGCADRHLGMLAELFGEPDDAQRHFERAIAFDEASGARPWTAHTRLAYAALLLRRARPGDSEHAAVLLQTALAAAEELGMHALERRIRALRSPSAARIESGPHPAGLTAREVQVLLMVADGKTNQDIAASLCRSVHTVANHVRHILAKVGASNRTEAAAFAIRHGLRRLPTRSDEGFGS